MIEIEFDGLKDDLDIDKPLKNILQRIMSIDTTASEARLEKQAKEDAQRRCANLVARLHSDAQRYRDCYLRTFHVDCDLQKSVLSQLVTICEQIPSFVDSGKQLFLWGSVGTGKDHLIVSVLRAAAMAGYSVRWVEGLTIYETIAGAFSDNTTHTAIYRKLKEPDILCISDPVFSENWSGPKAEALRKTVRARYNLGKATWITCNVENLQQADEMFGEDTFDRLQENTVNIECRWESNRRPAK